MRSRVGMYTVRMVPSSLLRWHKYNLEISFEIWKPSKNYFHFNVSSHNQADVGLPATKQIENQSFLLTWWSTGWDPLAQDSWVAPSRAPQTPQNSPRTPKPFLCQILFYFHGLVMWFLPFRRIGCRMGTWYAMELSITIFSILQKVNQRAFLVNISWNIFSDFVYHLMSYSQIQSTS